ncbi:MAG TPA: response regulator transcription factor [Ferruginibacter sp.]|jgi:two-component system invasion response regulator UvrY|nr:response regulator transcription factor [Ferruginibacter sp.]
MANIVLVDDHALLRKGLATLVRSLGHEVLFEADNGKDFIENLKPKLLPDIVLLDINMPEMDGYQTAGWLKANQPSVKTLALSMYDDENAIIRMLKNGAKGYLLKDSEPAELQAAIVAIMNKGYYYSDLVSGKLINAINRIDDDGSELKNFIKLTNREIDFLKHSCTELTYKEIADEMCVSPRTVDGYRCDLFDKLQVKSRIGLVIYAIKHGIVILN